MRVDADLEGYTDARKSFGFEHWSGEIIGEGKVKFALLVGRDVRMDTGRLYTRSQNGENI